MSLLITPKTFGAANGYFFFVFEGQKFYVACMYDGEIKFFIIKRWCWTSEFHRVLSSVLLVHEQRMLHLRRSWYTI